MKFKNTLILLVTMLLSIGAFAQFNGIADTFPSLVGDNTIVRQWKNNKHLLYTEEPNLNEKFVLIDDTPLTPTAKAVALKKQYKIKDFAVREDSVFFIGTYKNKGFWGYFDINNVFTNGDNITYFLTNEFSTSFGGPHGDDWGYYFTNFDELQIIPLPGATELLLTGFKRDETYAGGIMINFSDTPCLFHVKPPYTSFDYAYNASGSEKFDDIALNGNDIVVVGRENYTATDSANILFRVFTASNFDFTATISKEQIRQSQTPSMSKVLIESVGSISGNNFAVAHYGNRSPDQGLFVGLYSLNTPNTPYLIRKHYSFIPQGYPLASGCTLKKAAYCPISKTFCVLQDMMVPQLFNLYSTICRFEFANYPITVACTTSHKTNYGTNVNSVANGVNGVYDYILSSGKLSAKALFTRENASFQSSCFFHEPISLILDNNPRELLNTYMMLTVSSYSAARSTLAATPASINCALNCAH